MRKPIQRNWAIVPAAATYTCQQLVLSNHASAAAREPEAAVAACKQTASGLDHTSMVMRVVCRRFGIVTVDIAAALFWVNLPAVWLCIVLIPFSMFTVHDHGMHSMTSVWLLPVVPATMAAHTAGLMAQNAPEVKYGGVLIFMGECCRKAYLASNQWQSRAAEAQAAGCTSYTRPTCVAWLMCITSSLELTLLVHCKTYFCGWSCRTT